MPTSASVFGTLAVMSGLGLSSGLAADGAWKYEVDEQDHPGLSYLDSNGKTVFVGGRGHVFVVHAVYPGAPKRTKATITIK